MKKVIFALLLITIFLVAFGEQYWLERFSRVDLNPVEAISTNGNVVYAGVGGILNIYNIYQRDYPQLMGTVEGHSSRIKALIVHGSILYSLWEKEGLELFDISDPYTPELLSCISSETDERLKKFTTMDLDNGIMYIGGADFIASVDIDDPENPLLVGYCSLNGAPMKIDYHNNKLFVAAGKLGFGAFHVPQPDVFYLYGTQKGIYTTIKAYKNRILYGRLDEPKPDEKNLFGPHLFSFPFESPRVVRIQDDIIFAGGMSNFATYRLVEDRKNPVMIWSLSDLPTIDCTLLEDVIYLANNHRGISVFDITRVENPVEVGRIETSDVPQRGCIIDDKFFVAAGISGIIPIDMTSKETPIIGERFCTDKLSSVWDVKYHNGVLYVLGARDDFSFNIFIEKYDIDGNWIAEYPVAKVEKLESMGELAFDEKYWGISLGSQGIYILDAVNLDNLYHIKDGSIQYCDIIISNGYLYASDYYGGYQIWHLGDGAPEFTGSINTSSDGGNGILIIDKYLIAADGPNGIVVIDIGDPKLPQLVNTYPSVWGTDIAIEGDFLYLSDGEGACKVFDISDLPNIRLIDELSKSGYWTHIYTEDGYIYGVDALAGIYVYKLISDRAFAKKTPSTPAASAIFDAFPNPFNATTAISFGVAERSEIELSIFDISGRHVTTLIKDVVPAGNYSLHWNAEEQTSGTYFAVLNTSDSRSEQKLILLK